MSAQWDAMIREMERAAAGTVSARTIRPPLVVDPKTRALIEIARETGLDPITGDPIDVSALPPKQVVT